MASMVLDLQAAALDPNRRVSDLLRTVLLVATKLDIGEFRDWANRELRGYGNSDTVPPYRHVRGQLRAHNPYHGWVPVMLEDTAMHEKLSVRPIGQAVSELEDLYYSDRKDGTLQVPLQHDWLRKVFGHTEAFALGMVPTLLVDRSTIVGIIDAIRNVVLSWTLYLERNGILGTAKTFSQQEVAIAKTVPITVEALATGDGV